MSRSLKTVQGVAEIHPAVPDDAAAVRELRLEALATHPDAFGADYDWTAAQPSDYWSERITTYAREDSGVIAIARVAGRPIGMAGVAPRAK